MQQLGTASFDTIEKGASCGIPKTPFLLKLKQFFRIAQLVERVIHFRIRWIEIYGNCKKGGIVVY